MHIQRAVLRHGGYGNLNTVFLFRYGRRLKAYYINVGLSVNLSYADFYVKYYFTYLYKYFRTDPN
jgi:hypothetical protein